jgi:hypothetical protein
MAYIGRQNLGGAYRQLDDISSSFNGSTTAFTMQVNSTNVSLGDAANTSFFAILLGSDNGGTVTPTDASVTVSKLAIAGGEVKLDADGDTSITADTDDQIDFKTGGTDRMHIASDGDVLISKTSNAYQTTGHEFLDGGRAFHTADGGKALSLVRNSSNGAIMDFYNSGGSEVGSIETAASGIGIKLGGTASANLLDDYEEGTWTPSNSDVTLSVTSATYVKVGTLCHVQAYVTFPSNSNGSGAQIEGLPFTAGGGYAYLTGRAEGQSTQIVIQVNSGTTESDIYNEADAGLTNSALSGAYFLFSGTYITA